MSSSNPEFLDQLRQVVGITHVMTGDHLTAWEQDWRQRERGWALAVVQPASTEEVAQVVRLCAQHGTSIVPQGGNTGMVVGSTPDKSGTQVVLSLTRLQQIRQIDASNLTATVDAGCVLQTVQEACEAAGFLYPMSLGSEGSCTIGGNLATNAGGTQVVRYGNARELCLGIEVVNAQGEIWSSLSGLRKDNTGYDLRNLFIGSEGTLGVITAATMKMVPLPHARLTTFASVPSLQAAVDLLGLAHQHLNAGLTGFEVMGNFALSLVRKHFAQIRIPFNDDSPYYVVLENSDSESLEHARSRFESLLNLAFVNGCVTDAVVAENLAQTRSLWHVRESIPLAQAKEGLNIKHDISITTSRIPEFVEKADAALAKVYSGVRLVNYGHLGDGNLHYNVQAPENADAEAFLREEEKQVNDIVFSLVEEFGGSISAEHGIGSLKRDTLAQHKSPVALTMMKRIKKALDPSNLMNPGRVLSV